MASLLMVLIFLMDGIYVWCSVNLYGIVSLTLLLQIVYAIPDIDLLILVFKQSISDYVFNFFVKFLDFIDGYCNLSTIVKVFLWLKIC